MPKDYSIGYKFKGDASGYKKAMVEMNQSTKAFGATLKNLASTFIAGVGIKELINFSGESMKLAAAAEAVRTAFMRIGDSKKVLADIRSATRGVIDNEELMGIALKAQNFGIPLKDLAKMLEFSSNRALTTGNSIVEFANKFVEGVGRRMPKSLIQLQIAAKDAKAMFSHEGLGGVLEYTNGELMKMGSVMDTSQIRYQTLGAAIDNLKQAWGDFLNNSEAVRKSVIGITNALQDIADRGLWKVLSESKAETARHKAENAKWDTDRFGNLLSSLPTPVSVVPKPVEDLDLLKKAADAAAKALEKLKSANDKLWSSADQSQKYGVKTNMPESIYSAWKGIPRLKGGGMARGGNNLAGPAETAEAIKASAEAVQEMSPAVEELSNLFEDMFANMDSGFKGMVDSMIQSLKRLLSYLAAKAAIFGLISLILPGSSILTSLGNFSNFVFGGKFASGTNFAPGGLSMVGERGPELINLPRGSQVIPYKNQSMRIEVVGKISGKDLSLVMRRQNGF
jgi:hypothetical protein